MSLKIAGQSQQNTYIYKKYKKCLPCRFGHVPNIISEQSCLETILAATLSSALNYSIVTIAKFLQNIASESEAKNLVKLIPRHFVMSFNVQP